MGLDYGKKRCGISITDELQLIASPLTTVNTKDLTNFLIELIKNENISILVIGEPRDKKNNLFELEKSIRKFINNIKVKLPDIIIEIEDERFTSKLSSIYINQITNNRKVKIDK